MICRMDLLEDRSQLRHAYDNALEVFQSLRNMVSFASHLGPRA